VIVSLCAARDEAELGCDRFPDPDEIVVAMMQIVGIEEYFALCDGCERD
jgi:hypothetical protein